MLVINSFPGADYPDQILLHAVIIGQDIDADDTPPIISASENYKGALEHLNKLRELITEEIKKSGLHLPLTIHHTYLSMPDGYQWFLNRARKKYEKVATVDTRLPFGPYSVGFGY